MQYLTSNNMFNQMKRSCIIHVSCYNVTYYKVGFVLITETEQGVAQAIIRSVVDFKRDPWPKVSDAAKDLVKKMLNPDPKLRLTAQEVLGNVKILTFP